MSVVEPRDAPRALLVTLRVAGRAIAQRVAEPGERLLPDTPVDLIAAEDRKALAVLGSAGRTEVTPDGPVHVQSGDFAVDIQSVRRFRLPRFAFDQGFVVLPYLATATMLLVAQFAFLSLAMQAAAGGGGGFEPSAEYLARLLRGDTDGESTGVIARMDQARPAGEKIEGFYLPSGHAGPPTKAGGGANVGRAVRIGNPTKGGAPAAAPAPGPGGDQEVISPAADASADGVADADELEDPSEEVTDQPVAVHVTEGWGLSDWYDTEDAREDAKEIEQALKLAHRILKIDPDNPAALSVRSYYEYLAMDYPAATRTYEKLREAVPEDPAAWNNLALVYKRTGDYQTEEQLYRVALSLAPDDEHALVNLALCLGHQGRFDEAWAIMQKLDRINPDDPYADLHRAKISAAQGKREQAYRYLQKSLAGMRKLDTLHNIEFRQDIRLDVALEDMRHEERFRKLLTRYYGDQPEGWWQKLRP